MSYDSALVLVLQVVIYMLKHILSANVGSIITGVLCLAVLIGLKKVNERFKDKIKLPIPAELLVVTFWFILHKSRIYPSSSIPGFRNLHGRPIFPNSR